MKHSALFTTLALLLALCACENTDTPTVCKNLDCKHGTCYLELGSEACVCDKGYSFDENKICSICDTGYFMQNNTCVPEICTGHCLGKHEICDSTTGKPICQCEPGYAYQNDGTCALPDICKTTFTYTNPEASGNIYLLGSFNNWNKSQEFLLTPNQQGVYQLSIFLDPGIHEYKFYVENWGDNGWISDPNAQNVGNNGNSVIYIDNCAEQIIEAEKPHLVLTQEPTFENGSVTIQARFNPGTKGFPISGKPIATRNNQPVALNFDPNTSIITITETGFAEGGKIAYKINAIDANNKPTNELFVPIWLETTKFDWKDAIMYFTMTDRFFNGNPANDNPLGKNALSPLVDWMGGDFAGIEAKIKEGYFDKLGVNTLWLSPISQNTNNANSGSDGNQYSAYHGYWPITSGWSDTIQMHGLNPTEPHFGTLDELKSLINTAHTHGIRVMFDIVANHVHAENPIFLEHQNDGWFHLSPKHICDDGYWDSEPLTCWFSGDLPDINYEKHEIRDIMVDHAVWLIKETNVDGFRLDAVKHMRDDYLLKLREQIDAIFQNTGIKFYMIGETFDTNYEKLQKYISPKMLDGQFDFPLYYQILNTFVRGWGKFWEVKDFVAENDSRYQNAIMGTFMGNHDVPRAISYAANHIDDADAKGQAWRNNAPEVVSEDAYFNLRLAWAFLFTSPGIPLIYYGDEYGLEGAGDPGNRLLMEFDSDLNDKQKENLHFVQKLGKIRRDNKALSQGKRQTIDGKNDSWLYKMAYAGETIWIGLSRADYEDNYENLQVPQKGWIDLLNDNQPIPAKNTITLSGKQIIIWKEVH